MARTRVLTDEERLTRKRQSCRDSHRRIKERDARTLGDHDLGTVTDLDRHGRASCSEIFDVGNIREALRQEFGARARGIRIERDLDGGGGWRERDFSEIEAEISRDITEREFHVMLREAAWHRALDERIARGRHAG